MESVYEQLGVSAKKTDVHAAIAEIGPGLFPGAFCRIGEDVLGGDPQWCCALHCDGAGTKALVAYLTFRETGDADVFRTIAHDSLVMNLDDLCCIGAVDRLLLGNSIGRNTFHIPQAVLAAVIAGYEDSIQALEPYGVRIVSTGGETADVTDSIRTLVVDSTLATRLRRDHVIDNSRIQPGDVIVGLSSTGQAEYESQPNSGIGCNGLTLARHSLLAHCYAERYPESVADEVDRKLLYRGPYLLDDVPDNLGMSVGAALLSPTRTYAPVIRAILSDPDVVVHGIVHNTGGGQTKCKRFGEGIAYQKDNLFDPPPIFRLIAELGRVSWQEMYQTFNMGHRMELMMPPAGADAAVEICRRFGIDARIVGRCERAGTGENLVTITSEFGTFRY